jgi:hypothetical protein
MLDLSLEIKRKDGTSETHIVYPDSQIDFETKFGVSIVGAFSDGQAPKMTHLYYLAWLAEKNAGKVVKPFDEWKKDIAGVTNVDNSGN